MEKLSWMCDNYSWLSWVYWEVLQRLVNHSSGYVCEGKSIKRRPTLNWVTASTCWRSKTSIPSVSCPALPYSSHHDRNKPLRLWTKMNKPKHFLFKLLLSGIHHGDGILNNTFAYPSQKDAIILQSPPNLQVIIQDPPWVPKPLVPNTIYSKFLPIYTHIW